MNYIDIHSHILPEMDDGSRSMEQSIHMLQIAVEEGIDTIYVTPHHMPGKGHHSKSDILQKMEQLQRAATEAGIHVKLKTGTEYYYRGEFLELLEQEQAVTMGDSECILVEFEPMAERTYIRNSIREILSTGYTPIIAHAERYATLMEKNFETLEEMKKMGALLQVNAASVIGDNGRQTRGHVKSMLKKELIDFIGTDAHSDGRRAPYIAKCAEYLTKKYGKEYADALLYGNAQQLL